MASKHEIQFDEQDFEDILKQEKQTHKDAKSKILHVSSIASTRQVQSNAQRNWGKAKAHARAKAKVKSKLNAFFRRKQYQQRKSTTKTEETLETSATHSSAEPSTSTSHVPSRIRRLSHRREMEEFVLPPREKSESYMNMYT